jgi:putative DNA primase/helicase
MSASFYAAATHTAQQNQNGAAPSGRTAVIVEASSIIPEEVAWLWPGRLARGALTNCVGLPDQGKSLIFTDLAARITTGAPMPPAPRIVDPDQAARVLIMTAEDAFSYTLVPRLIKAGANLTCVDFVRMVKDAEGHMSLLTLETDLDALAVALQAKAYRLMVVDGIAGYLGTAKTHNDADVRRVLTPFITLLESTRVAGFSVMHPPKAITSLAYYAGGSVAFTGLPRVALGVAPDPSDPAPSPRRLLLKIKGNLYGHVPTLAYHIVADSPSSTPWLEWVADPVEVNTADVLDPPRENPDERSRRQACEAWLHAFLKHGPKPSSEVEDAAKAEGFSLRTLRRARERVADSVKVGSPTTTGSQQWEWVLRL